MADLIALLMASLSALMVPGIKAEDLNRELARVIKSEQPAPHDAIKVSCENVSAYGIEKLTFDFDGLLLDPVRIKEAQIVIKRITKGSDGRLSIAGMEYTAEITQEDLTIGLRAAEERLRDATVAISVDGVGMKGTYPMVLGARVSFNVFGQLYMDRETLLMYSIERSGVAGISLPKNLRKKLQNEVNPVYDLAKFRSRSEKDIKLAKEKLSYDFNLSIKDITPLDGRIVIGGSA